MGTVQFHFGRLQISVRHNYLKPYLVAHYLVAYEFFPQGFISVCVTPK